MRVLNKAKKFEKFVLMFIWNPYPCINYRYNQILFKIDLFDFNLNLDTSLQSKFQSIRLKRQKNLYQSLFICFNKWTKLLLFKTLNLDLSIFFRFFAINIYKIWNKLNLFILSLSLLYFHYLFYCFYDIKFTNIFYEFSIFNLRIIQHILNHNLHEIWWCLLNINTLT